MIHEYVISRRSREWKRFQHALLCVTTCNDWITFLWCPVTYRITLDSHRQFFVSNLLIVIANFRSIKCKGRPKCSSFYLFSFVFFFQLLFLLSPFPSQLYVVTEIHFFPFYISIIFVTYNYCYISIQLILFMQLPCKLHAVHYPTAWWKWLRPEQCSPISLLSLRKLFVFSILQRNNYRIIFFFLNLESSIEISAEYVICRNISYTHLR